MSNEKMTRKAPKKYGDLKYFDNAKPRFKPTVDSCDNCDGEGIIEMGSMDAPMVVKCSECDGRGWNEKQQPSAESVEEMYEHYKEIGDKLREALAIIENQPE